VIVLRIVLLLLVLLLTVAVLILAMKMIYRRGGRLSRVTGRGEQKKR